MEMFMLHGMTLVIMAEEDLIQKFITNTDLWSPQLGLYLIMYQQNLMVLIILV